MKMLGLFFFLTLFNFGSDIYLKCDKSISSNVSNCYDDVLVFHWESQTVRAFKWVYTVNLLLTIWLPNSSGHNNT